MRGIQSFVLVTAVIASFLLVSPGSNLAYRDPGEMLIGAPDIDVRDNLPQTAAAPRPLCRRPRRTP